MTQLYTTEINSKGDILSVTNNCSIQSFTIGGNIFRAFDLSTKKLFEEFLGQLFSDYHCLELTIELNRENCIATAHRYSEERAYIHWKCQKKSFVLKEHIYLKNYAYENVPIGIKIMKRNGDIYDCNVKMHEILGYTKDEMLRINISQIDTGFNDFQECWDGIVSLGGLPFIRDYKKKTGEVVQVEIMASIMKYGEQEFLYAFVNNVTDKLRIEKDLKRIDFAFRNTTTAMHFMNKDGSIFDFNTAAHTMFGYTKDEYKNISVIDISTRHNPETWDKRWEEIKQNKISSYTTKLKKKGNIIIEAELKTEILNYGDKEISLSFFNDVTEKKILERKLKLIDFSFRNAGTAILYIYENGSIYDYNQAFLDLFGYDDEDIKRITIFDFYHTNQAEWQEQWELFKKSRVKDYKLKIKKKNGSFIDIDVVINYIYFEEVELICIFITDITEKIRKEEKLRLVDHAFKNSGLPMSFARLDGSFLDFNNAVNQLFGYTREQFLQIKAEDLNPLFNKEMWAKRVEDIRSGQKYNSVRLHRKDKMLLELEVYSSIIQYEGADIVFTNYIDLTPRIKYERELQQSNERYENATIATSDAVWESDLELNKVYLSKNFTRLFGHAIDGAENSRNNILQRNIHKEDVDRVNNVKREVANGSIDNWEVEYRFKKSNGDYAFVIDRGFSIKDEKGKVIKLIGSIQDITKSKAEQLRLKLMESVVLRTNDGVLITEAFPINAPGPRILFVNEAFTKMTGYTFLEALGNTPRILQSPQSEKRDLEIIKKALENGQPSETTLKNRNKDGEEKWVNLRISPLSNEKGEITHWIAVRRDVTNEVESATEKEKLIAELTESNKELKQFTYITTHNLRAPLTNLISVCNIIDTSKIPDAFTVSLFEMFKSSTIKLNETLNDLMDMLVIKQNPNIQLEKLSFQKVLDKVVASISSNIAQNGCTIKANFNGSENVTFNPSYLESIFLNLLTNSIKYAHPNRLPTITIETQTLTDSIQLTFSDNGVGMNMQLVGKKIFGLYQRFHNNSDSKGIGLYLIHSQVTALGASISVDSEVNKGTTFTIHFKKN